MGFTPHEGLKERFCEHIIWIPFIKMIKIINLIKNSMF